MSAISQSAKFSFGGFLKNLFHRSGRNGAAAHAAEPEVTGAAEQESPAPVGRVTSVAGSSFSAVGSNGNGKPNGVPIPLQAILAGLPLELRARVKRPEVGDMTVTIAFEKILGQLSSGTVKV